MKQPSSLPTHRRPFVVIPALVVFSLTIVGGCGNETAPGSSPEQPESEQSSVQPDTGEARGIAETDTARDLQQPVEQQSGTSAATASFTAEQLEQMVAPIALYPDPLLTQILMAATYPAEVAEAAAWVKDHPSVNGRQLDDAIADKNWATSVNSLAHAPKALDLLAANTRWAQDLGEAFLTQQDDVLNAVQVMRVKACDLGNLKTTAQQKVIIEPSPPQYQPREQVVVAPPPRIVRIEPVSPQVVYVPTYNPGVIFGPPPPQLLYPSAFAYASVSVGVAPVIAFGAGLALGSMFWGDLDWDHHHVYPRRYGHGYYGGDRDYYTHGDSWRERLWRYDPRHRRGVGYRNPFVARQYGPAGIGPRGPYAKEYEKAYKEQRKAEEKAYEDQRKAYEKTRKDRRERYERASRERDKAYEGRRKADEKAYKDQRKAAERAARERDKAYDKAYKDRRKATEKAYKDDRRANDRALKDRGRANEKAYANRHASGPDRHGGGPDRHGGGPDGHGGGPDGHGGGPKKPDKRHGGR